MSLIHGGDELFDGEIGHLDENFEKSYAFIASQPITWVTDQMRKLGWPPDKVAVRVLTNVGAAERLANRAQASLALIKAVVAVEDMEGNLYVVQTPALVEGRRLRHHNANDRRVGKKVEELFGVSVL